MERLWMLGQHCSAAMVRCLAWGVAPLVILSTACQASAPPKTAVSSTNPSSAQTPIVVPTTYVTPVDAGTLAARFAQANALLTEGQFAQAAAAFDAVAQLEPTGVYGAASLFNAGLAYEQAEERKTALARYRSLARQFPNAKELPAALVRASRLVAYEEDWAELQRIGEQLRGQPKLTPLDQVEAYGAIALGQVEQGQLDAAAVAVSKARDIIEEQRYSDAGKLPVAVSQVFFALGEIRRLRGQRIQFVPVPSDFANVLEQRCQLLLDAQDAFAEAMRSYDAHWSAMAGYRVGQLYQSLHGDLMAVPAPAGAKTERQRQLFEGAMQLRYRVLLEKGLRMIDRTVAMAERTGERSAWVARAREAQRQLQQSLEQTKAALEKLPYTEADLKRALDSLSAKSSAQTP